MVGRVLVLGMVALLAGCGADAEQQGAADVALAFAQASPQQACLLLAPQTARTLGDCVTGLTAADLPGGTTVTGATVAGLSAQVRLDSQVLFLAKFEDGWKVTAAGCARDDPDPAVPYDCEVEP